MSALYTLCGVLFVAMGIYSSGTPAMWPCLVLASIHFVGSTIISKIESTKGEK